MADFLGGLLSGGGGLYDDLLTPQQRDQLSSRGLLSMAGAFADAAMPSRLPIPLGAAIGKAAAAMSGGRDEAALRLLQGQKLAQEVQTMKATSALQQQFMKDIQTLPLDVLFKRYGIGAGGGVPGAAPTAPTAPAAPPTTAPLPAAPAASGGLLDADLAGGYTGAMPAVAPPGYDADLSGAPAASTGVPLKASSLRPPDTVLPPGGGLGGLLTPASYNGGGAGTPPFGPGGEPTLRLAASRAGGDPPGGDPWLMQNAPFPTLQRPNTPPIQWTNDQPTVPFGQAPGDVLPGGGTGSAPATNLDTVIPSGRGVPADMLQRVADKGGVPGAPGAPTPPVPPGVDPQAMNTLLLELAKRNAMAEILKLGNPYGSMLSVLQGSPEYKAQIETATRGAGLPFIRKEAEEKAIGGYGVDIATRTYQAGLDAANKEKEQIGAAARDLTTVNLPDGNGNLIERQVTRAQAIDIAHGLPVPELGFKGMYGPGVGKPVLTKEQEAQQAIDAKYLEEKRVAAEASKQSINSANDMRGLIEKGVIAGSYADERTRLLKLGQVLKLTGENENELIRNTENYIAQAGSRLKDGLKGLGPPVSNVDIGIAEKIAGGQNLTTQGMLDLLKIQEKYHRLNLQDYGKLLKNAPASRYDKSVKEPPTYGAPVADGPNGPIWYSGKDWVPF